MKKYFEIARITWKSMLVYRVDVFTGAAFSILKILLAYLMWSIIFMGREEVGGYSFRAMITYYIIISMLGRVDQSDGMVWQFMDEIKNGRFSKYVVRPLRPMLYFMAVCYSKSLYTLCFNLPAAVLWALIFRSYFESPVSLMNSLLSGLVFLLGLNFMMLFNYFLSLLSFKFLNIGGLNIMKLNFIEFVSGALIPLAILPALVVKAFSLLPFYYTLYYPAALYLGRNDETPLLAIVVMIFWNLLMIAAGSLYYKKSVRSFEGVGI